MSNQEPVRKKRSYHCPNPKCKQSFTSHEKLKEHMRDSIQLGLDCNTHLLHCDHCNESFTSFQGLRQHLNRNKKCNKYETFIDEGTTMNHRTTQSFIAEGNSVLSTKDARGYNIETATLTQIRNQNPEFYLHSLDNRAAFNSRFHLGSLSHKLNDVAHSKSNLMRNGYTEMDPTNEETTFVTFMEDLERTNEEEEEVINIQHPPPTQTQIHGSILEHVFQKDEWDFSNDKNPIEEILSAGIDEDIENGLDNIDKIKDDMIQTRAKVSSSPIQKALITLYKLVFKIGGESLYEKVVKWATDHYLEIQSLAKLGYKPNIKTIVKKELYGSKYQHLFKPKVNSIILSTGRKVSIPTISITGAIADLLVSRKGDELAVPTGETHTHYDELRSGSWWSKANSTLCTQPLEAMEPITGFIDAVAIGQYGKKSMIPAMFTLSSFNIDARQKEDNWRVFAFIDHKNQLPKLKNKNAAKLQMFEYHEIMSVAFAELIVLQKYGFQWTSKNLDGSISRQKIKVPLQLLIGDCEGAGDLCGRVPSHLRTVPCLCRSCDVPHQQGRQHTHNCNHFKQIDMVQKSEEELKDLAFYKIKNPFYKHLCFGNDENGIFGCTPNEVLHQFEQGLCDYIVDEIINQLKGTARQLVDSICIYICDSFSSQSERNFPSLLALP